MALDLTPVDLGDVSFYTGSYTPARLDLTEDGSPVDFTNWTNFEGFMRRDANATPFDVVVTNNIAVTGRIILKVTAAQLSEQGMRTEGGLLDIKAIAPGETEYTYLAFSQNVLVLDNVSA